jgi:hypothetical protein
MVRMKNVRRKKKRNSKENENETARKRNLISLQTLPNQTSSSQSEAEVVTKARLDIEQSALCMLYAPLYNYSTYEITSVIHTLMPINSGVFFLDYCCSC